MYDLTGEVRPYVNFTAKGRPVITIEVEEKISALCMVEELKGKRLSIKIGQWRQKRSLDANAYLWKLCSLIAEKLSDDGEPYTKNEIYQRAIKAKGIYREQGELNPDFAKTMRTAWEKLGIGWVTEQVDFEPDGERVIVRFYYGSSTYTSKQLARVIDWLRVECYQLGIETKSNEEIRSLLNSWGQKANG